MLPAKNILRLQFIIILNVKVFITLHGHLYEQFAGAAQSLGAGALLVNPWNITEVAAAIGKALNMSDEEREKRHKLNFDHVTEHTAQQWAETFVR